MGGKLDKNMTSFVWNFMMGIPLYSHSEKYDEYQLLQLIAWGEYVRQRCMGGKHDLTSKECAGIGF